MNAHDERDDERYLEAEEERHEAERDGGLVHSRPDYSARTDSTTFPCGLPGGSPVRVAWAGQTVTCPGCIAAEEALLQRIAESTARNKAWAAAQPAEVVEHDGSHPDCRLCELNSYWAREGRVSETVMALKQFVDDSWAEVMRTHEELSGERTHAAVDAYIAAIAMWREAIGLYDREVMTRIGMSARVVRTSGAKEVADAE